MTKDDINHWTQKFQHIMASSEDKIWETKEEIRIRQRLVSLKETMYVSETNPSNCSTKT